MTTFIKILIYAGSFIGVTLINFLIGAGLGVSLGPLITIPIATAIGSYFWKKYEENHY